MERTNGVPLCPVCLIGTRRSTINSMISTSVSSDAEKIYDEKGHLENPDTFELKRLWKCLECNKEWWE